MKKIITSIALLVSLNAACSQQSKNSIALISYGDTDSIALIQLGSSQSAQEKAKNLCTATYTTNSSSPMSNPFLNINSKSTCADMIKTFKQQQKMLNMGKQAATIELCTKKLWHADCSTVTVKTVQAAINAIQSFPAYQASLKK